MIPIKKPLDHAEVKQFLPQLWKDSLDAETRGRVQGHLHDCNECLMAFGDEIDAAIEKGLLPKIDVPTMPSFQELRKLTNLPVVDLVGSGVLEGFRWEAVKSWLTAPADRFIPLAAAAREALGAVAASALDDTRDRAQWIAARLANPSEFLADFSRRLHKLLVGPEPAPAGFTVLGPVTIEVLHADASGQSIGPPIRLDPDAGDVEEPPTITSQGVFRLTVSSDDPALAGGRLVAILRLIEGDAVRFEAELVPVAGGQRWRAVFLAEDLPKPSHDMTIPWSQVVLVAISA
jgi:hypothetical protein